MLLPFLRKNPLFANIFLNDYIKNSEYKYMENMNKNIENSNANNKLQKIRTLITCGDVITTSLCKRWFKNFSIPLINAYGPAECSDDLTFYHMNNNTKLGNNIPIGWPIQNLQVYII